jgi:quercetin dioxygenase-like cupin family protein
MNENELKKRLRKEGFKNVYVWQDGPPAFYPDHTRAEVTAHIILEGEMTVTSEGKTRTRKTGERFDVLANTIHSAKMGPRGCRHLVGEM